MQLLKRRGCREKREREERERERERERESERERGFDNGWSTDMCVYVYCYNPSSG